jgi:hypothetical protein
MHCAPTDFDFSYLLNKEVLGFKVPLTVGNLGELQDNGTAKETFQTHLNIKSRSFLKISNVP